MPSFQTQRLANHSAAKMFDLVADMESYPQFVPMCVGLRVRSRTQNAGGLDVVTAAMAVGYKAIRETFTSKVTLDRDNLRIGVEFLDGPFKQGGNSWAFLDLPQERGEASRVDFSITYEFSSRVLALLMGSMFDSAFRRFAQAFEERANVVYGRDGAGKVL